MLLLPAFAFTCAAQSWVMQESGTQASLRGLQALNERVVWASGTGGTYIVTTDGGKTWRAATVPGAERLDFRDLHAADAKNVYLLSIGAGESSRIYKTADGGSSWKLMFTNPDAKGFFDALAFWDAKRGIIVGDAVDGHATVFTTSDGGEHWQRQSTPAAVPNEGSFAASGTCLIVRGDREAWFATGGTGAARVFHSTDGGKSWTVAATPVRNDGPSAGIFSLTFSNGRRGIAVGGDYSKDKEAEKNIAVTIDGGRTWTAPAIGPAGFRSAVSYVSDRKMWVATGTSGSDISLDDGATWKKFDDGAFNSLSFVSAETGWAVGPRGRVAEFQPR